MNQNQLTKEINLMVTGMVVQPFDSITREAVAGGLLRMMPAWPIEMRPCLKLSKIK